MDSQSRTPDPDRIGQCLRFSLTELRDMPASAPDAAVNGPDASVAMIERVVTIPADHPSLPGHFPGRPIVPAVVILDEVGR